MRRTIARDALSRGNVLSQALIGSPGQFTAQFGLGLDPADWPLGESLPPVQLHYPLSRLGYADLHRRALDGAARLRKVSRDPTLTEPLNHLVAWVLNEPGQRLSVIARVIGDHPRAVLLGLVDILDPLVPGPWSFSTRESAESHAYRLIVMPEWPRAGSPEHHRLRLGGSLAPDEDARLAAEMLVARYQEHGLEGLEILGRDAGHWHQMQPAERTQSLVSTLSVHATGPACPRLPSDAVPEPTPAYASAYPIEGADELGGSAVDTMAEQPDATAEEAPETPAPAQSPSSTPDFPEPPAEDPASTPKPGRFNAAALVEWLLQPHSETDDRQLRLSLESEVDRCSAQEIDAACLKAIGLRLGLADAEGTVSSWGKVTLNDPQYLYDLLIHRAIAHEEPAHAWAAFLRDEAAVGLPEPLRKVVRRMFDQSERHTVVIHHAFFVVLGHLAIPPFLCPDAPTHSLRRPARTGGLSPDVRLIAKAYLLIFVPLAGVVLLIWLTLL